MPIDWTAILCIALGASVFTVAAMRLKARLHGDRSAPPPMLIHLGGYFIAYVLALLAADMIDRPWSLLAMAAVAALAFAVTMNGDRPLMSAVYVRTASLTFATLAGLWVLHLLLLEVGIDLVAKDFVRRP